MGSKQSILHDAVELLEYHRSFCGVSLIEEFMWYQPAEMLKYERPQSSVSKPCSISTLLLFYLSYNSYIYFLDFLL